MRTEIKELHQRLDSSIDYVTRDQIAAMTLATKIEIARMDGAPIILNDTKNRDLPENVILGVRPEDIAEPAGADTFVDMQLGGKHVTARLHAETSVWPGHVQQLAFDLGKVSYFAPETGQRLN